MKRLLRLVPVLFLVSAGQLLAAGLSGNVTFVTKRGQRPNIAETLVWLEPVGAKPARRNASSFQMTTRGKTLIPHILAIPAGSTVLFPNEDPISHNLFSLSNPNTFDLGLYRRGAGKSETFEVPGVINVYCNVHPTMSAVIHVMTTPYYGFTDASGRYSFDVPAGRYRVVAWNEQGGQTETTVDVPATGLGTVAMTIDSRNVRTSQHTDKHGKAYKAPSARDY